MAKSESKDFPLLDFMEEEKTLPETLTETVLTVSEFLDLVNDIIKPLKVVVRGEVTSAQQRGNSIYFSISDKTDKAILSCYLYRTNPAYYMAMLKEGAEVELSGSPSIYKPFGKFSLNVSQVTPVGEGALKAAFEALKKQLQEEGYFELQRKRDIPPFVKKIGLITSEFGDARKDFVTHLGQHGFHISFKDVRVEGMYAISSIVQAIHWFNTHTSDVDVLVLTRGGGSLESLQAFNSLEVAEAIFGSRIPVISAVGHENDITIADLVADIRASTPTHAGKIIAEPWLLAQDKVERIEKNILHLFSLSAESLKRELTMVYDKSLQKFSHHLMHLAQHLSMTESNMVSHFKTVFSSFQCIEQDYRQNTQRFMLTLSSSQKNISERESVMQKNSELWLNRLENKLAQIDNILTLSNPEKRLKQGYSITRNKEGRVVKSISQVSTKDTISIQVADGTVTTSVT